jgi:LysM repeat protein
MKSGNRHFAVLLLMLFGCFSHSLIAQNVKFTTDDYIRMYKDLAIEEMKLYKVPASITLAQGILESDNGNSVLARNTNNHFGIKCKAEWTGQKYYHDDDEAQECFRKYPTVQDSYRDHSLFLKNRQHYAFLFTLDIKDYKGWARGLKQAGYATNPTYAEQLINLIETYNLAVYDQGGNVTREDQVRDSLLLVRMETNNSLYKPVRKDSLKPVVHDDQEEFQEVVLTDGNRASSLNNGVHYILAKRNDTYEKIAEDLGLFPKDLYRYNDVEKDYKVSPGEKVYIEPKKDEASTAFHTVADGETMFSIAQYYGIKLKSLYFKNRMKPGTEPEKGQRLWLQENAPVY